MTIPTSEQVGAAIAALAKHFRSSIAVCAFAGLRLGEAAGLPLGDVVFLRRTIQIRRQIQDRTPETAYVTEPKCGSERVLSVPLAFVELLARHVEVNGTRGDEQWLLSNENDRTWLVDSAGHQ